MTFSDLALHPDLLRAVTAEGYQTPTPIQVDAIPAILAGSDIMGCAQTGTGKTAAFALPILHQLIPTISASGHRPIRTLVLAPTRELAAQIHVSFNSYGRFTGLRYAVIFGGVKQGRQVADLKAGVDVLVATPGRLLDLMNQGFVRFDSLQHLVLDEADNMLDMGFIHDIRKIISRIPKKRQTLMFSATMPPEIRALADTILRSPVRVQVAKLSSVVDTVDHSVIFADKAQKPSLLVHYLRSSGFDRVLVFSRTKHGADRIARGLVRCGIRAAAIHGNKSQNARTRAMSEFKSAQPPVLVATDIAARGLDIDEISHVVNYDLPNVPETYVHRIGRTGRAGESGTAISFCDSEERDYLRDIERLIRKPVRVDPLPQNLPNVKPAEPGNLAGIGRHPQSAAGAHAKPFRHQDTHRQSSRPARNAPSAGHTAPRPSRNDQQRSNNPNPPRPSANPHHQLGRGVKPSSPPVRSSRPAQSNQPKQPTPVAAASASLSGMSGGRPTYGGGYHPIYGNRSQAPKRRGR